MIGDQPCRVEIAQRDFDGALAREMQAWIAALEQGRDRRAVGHRKRRFVQPCRLAQRGRDDHAWIGAGDHRFGKLAFDQVRLARKGAIHDRVELQLGRVGHDGHDIVERDLALAVGIERKLAQLVARGLTVAAEQ